MLLCWAGTASVQAAPARLRDTARAVVMISPASQRDASNRTLQAIRGQLSDVAVALRVYEVTRLAASGAAQLAAARTTAISSGALVVFWFDETTGDVSIYLHAKDGGRLVRRKVKAAGPEGRFEALAVIVRFAVRAHLQGEKVGVRLPPALPRRPIARPAPRKSPAHPRKPPPKRQARVGLEAAYEADIYNGDPQLAHGLHVALLVHPQRRWTVYLAFRMEAPLDTENEHAGISLRRYPIELGARFEWRWSKLLLGAQLGLSVTPFQVKTWVKNGEHTADSVPVAAVVSVAPSLVLAYRIIKRLTVRLTIGARIQLNPYRQVVDTEDPQGRLVLEPWRVQPTLSLGLSTPLF